MTAANVGANSRIVFSTAMLAPLLGHQRSHMVMNPDKASPLIYDIELKAGEALKLPDALISSIGPGQWRITVQPISQEQPMPTRDHTAFLKGYSPEDEGLYDNYPTR